MRTSFYGLYTIYQFSSLKKIDWLFNYLGIS